MKKKQIFFLEKTEGEEKVAIRTHLNKYLRCDGDGEFKADGEQGDDETFWTIEAQSDGRWALKNVKYGWYAGAAGREIEGAKQCFVTQLDESKLFTVKLAMHPMVTIQNIKRSDFVHCNDEGDKLTTDEVIPWGDDAVLMIMFNDNGTYCIGANNGKVLKNDGSLADARAEDGSCDYIIEFHGGVIALKNLKSGKYVTSLGGAGLCKATKSSVTADEKYEMHNSYPQVTLESFNKKFVSCKQGVELAASVPKATSDQEIFQLEPQDNGKWKIVAATKGSTEPEFWTQTEGGGLSYKHDEEGEKEFNIEFHGTAIAIQCANGKYVKQQKNGYLKADGDDASGESLFQFSIVNRPRLVLRGHHGFVATLPSGLLECNKSEMEMFAFETSSDGVAIKGANGKYWGVTDTGISANGDAAEYYHIELYKNSKCTITHDGKTFMGAQNGAFTASGVGATEYTLFEY